MFVAGRLSRLELGSCGFASLWRRAVASCCGVVRGGGADAARILNTSPETAASNRELPCAGVSSLGE